MGDALAVLPAVTHLALHIPEHARTDGMYWLNERTIEPPGFMQRALEMVLREKRIVVLVVDVTELDESHQKDTKELIRELADDRVRMLVDNRPRYLRWENDWRLGRGVWDGHECV